MLLNQRIGENPEADNDLGVGGTLEVLGIALIASEHYASGLFVVAVGAVCLRNAFRGYSQHQTETITGQQGSDTVE